MVLRCRTPPTTGLSWRPIIYWPSGCFELGLISGTYGTYPVKAVMIAADGVYTKRSYGTRPGTAKGCMVGSIGDLPSGWQPRRERTRLERANPTLLDRSHVHWSNIMKHHPKTRGLCPFSPYRKRKLATALTRSQRPESALATNRGSVHVANRLVAPPQRELHIRKGQTQTLEFLFKN
jgi:hypothetical protein